jgi:hypothetical protein
MFPFVGFALSSFEPLDSRNLPGESDKTHKKPQSDYPVSGTIFELKTSRIRSSSTDTSHSRDVWCLTLKSNLKFKATVDTFVLSSRSRNAHFTTLFKLDKC